MFSALGMKSPAPQNPRFTYYRLHNSEMGESFARSRTPNLSIAHIQPLPDFRAVVNGRERYSVLRARLYADHLTTMTTIIHIGRWGRWRGCASFPFQ